MSPSLSHPTAGVPGFADRLGYGADYNPEQWPREVWPGDVDLMVRAGVTMVTVGVFAWGRLQPAADRWDFDWLDEVLDLLHAGGIAVDLATATASPPPWLTTAHPEVLLVDADGRTRWPGGRQHWRPTSPVFREHALELVRRLAQRYGGHPALAAWHVSNELGCHNVHDYSDDAAVAFRVWCRERHGSLDALNDAWSTAFWSQHYSDWAQILPPRLAGSATNPAQTLDFARFSSDALRAHLRAERAVLTELTPHVPVTTNFMVMGGTSGMDYASWVDDVDVISNDHYPVPGPQEFDELSFSANLVGGLAGGRPWWLMEHAPGAVNWQPVNRAKRAGELARDALTHVAHGADAICFFQWRQSAGGAERYHSAMVPHAGTDSAVFRDVSALGASLAELAELAGSHRAGSPVAILFDWPSWWATRQDFLPSSRLDHRRVALDCYSALLELGVPADVVPADTDLTGYELVIAPMLHVIDDERRARLDAYVGAGGHLVATYFSGVADAYTRVHPGPYPGALRELLGVRVEEFVPLLDDESVEVDIEGVGTATGTVWTDRVELLDPAVQVLARYRSGELSGGPAVTRRAAAGGGSATWVSTHLDPAGLTALLGRLLPDALTSVLPPALRGRVELAARRAGERWWWFLINRGTEPVTIPLSGPLAGDVVAGGTGPVDPAGTEIALAGRGVGVVRRRD